jgi:hypothetical protein
MKFLMKFLQLILDEKTHNFFIFLAKNKFIFLNIL